MKKKPNNAKEIFTNIGIGIGAALLAGAAVICDGNTSTYNNTYKNTSGYIPEVEGPKIYKKVLKLKKDAERIYNDECHTFKKINHMDGSCTIIVRDYDDYSIYNYRREGIINDIKLPDGSVVIFRYAYSNNRLVGAQISGINYTFEYDYKGRIIKESTERYYKCFEYDYRGNTTRIYDNKGYWREYVYNARNQILTESGSGRKTKIYEYDYRGNLVNIIER